MPAIIQSFLFPVCVVIVLSLVTLHVNEITSSPESLILFFHSHI